MPAAVTATTPAVWSSLGHSGNSPLSRVAVMFFADRGGAQSRRRRRVLSATATSGIVADLEMRRRRHPRRDPGMDRHDSPGRTGALAEPVFTVLAPSVCVWS